MKRLQRIFELTVAEQRAIIVLLVIYLLYMSVAAHRSTAPHRVSPNETQPSPSPGILP
ncbi:MAG: hypothetical protein M3032_12715 [Verrucomicrobiota bacterium]|nr:hypothetical protein [Verrucomicrobiota bacterium]